MFTIVPDDNVYHIRATLKGRSDFEELIAKLKITMEKIDDRPASSDSLPAVDVPSDSTSGTVTIKPQVED